MRETRAVLPRQPRCPAPQPLPYEVVLQQSPIPPRLSTYAASAQTQAGEGLYQLKLWDLASGEGIRVFDGHSKVITSVAFSPDGRYLLSGGLDLTVRLWDVASGKEIRKFTGHVKQVQSVAFSPDGRLAISTSYDGDVRLWNVADGSPSPSLESDGESVVINCGR